MARTNRPLFELGYWDMTERQKAVALGCLIAASTVPVAAVLIFKTFQVANLPSQWRYAITISPLLSGAVIYAIQRFGLFA